MKRLDQLKASKMKELFLKKQKELEEICHRSHMEIPSRAEMDNIINLISSGGPIFKYPFSQKDLLLFFTYLSSPETDLRV